MTLREPHNNTARFFHTRPLLALELSSPAQVVGYDDFATSCNADLTCPVLLRLLSRFPIQTRRAFVPDQFSEYGNPEQAAGKERRLGTPILAGPARGGGRRADRGTTTNRRDHSPSSQGLGCSLLRRAGEPLSCVQCGKVPRSEPQRKTRKNAGCPQSCRAGNSALWPRSYGRSIRPRLSVKSLVAAIVQQSDGCRENSSRRPS